MYINYNKNSFTRSKNLTDFLKEKDDGVFYIGHASILVRLSKKKYLFDTIMHSNFYNNSWCFFPSQVKDKRLLDVDGVFVSHIHQDHYDPDFLKQIQKRNIPIYILDGRKNFSLDLKQKKIKNIKIKVNKKVLINKDKNIWVYGCLHEYNDIDCSILISNNNLSVYHGNDNFITKKSLQPFKRSVGQIDIGCIPFAFIHYYPYLLDCVSKNYLKKEGRRLEKQFMNYGIMQSKILKPKIVIPFGSNLFHSDNPNSLINKAVATPIDFVKYAKNNHIKMKKNYKSMLSNSYCLKKKSKIYLHYEDISTKKFNFEMKKFIKKINNNKKESYTKALNINHNHLSSIKKKILNIKDKIDHKILVDAKSSNNSKILINLLNKEVSIYKNKVLPNNCHFFKIENNEYNMWLENKLTFEEVLGTRRFRYIRMPNVYNVKIMQIYTNYL